MIWNHIYVLFQYEKPPFYKTAYKQNQSDKICQMMSVRLSKYSVPFPR